MGFSSMHIFSTIKLQFRHKMLRIGGFNVEKLR